MQKYSDTILNRQGKPVAGAVVVVTSYPGNEPAVIYAVDGGQPVESVTSDKNGRFAFYAADGHYNLSITGRNIDPITVTDLLLFDPAAGFDPAPIDAMQGEIKAAQRDLAAITARVGQAEGNAVTLGASLTAATNRVAQAEKDIEALQLGASGMAWSGAVFPMYAAHRGMEMSFPENTLLAFQEAVKAGAGAVEMDCYLMADGNVAVMHDSSTARTCRLPDGTAIALNIESLSAFDLYGLDASYKVTAGENGFHGSDFENNPPPLLLDVLTALKGKALLLIEAKGTSMAKRLANAQAIANLVDKLKMQASVVIQSIHKPPTEGPVDFKGCRWAFITATAQMTGAQLDELAIANGCYMVIMDKTGIDPAYKALVNSKGMKLCGYTYSRPDELATVVPDVVLATDTTIVSRKRLAGSRDALMRKYPGPGYTRDGFGSSPSNTRAAPVIRTIGNKRAIGWDVPKSGTTRTLICCLDPDPDNDGQYTLDFDAIWTGLDATTSSFCLVSVEIDVAGTLVEASSLSTAKRGYSIGFRANGGAAIYRLAGDTPTATNIASATGLPNPPVLNQAYPCRIVVNSTGITATFDVGGLNIVMTANDTTYRNGKYIQLERRGHGFMIANLRAS